MHREQRKIDMDISSIILFLCDGCMCSTNHISKWVLGRAEYITPSSFYLNIFRGLYILKIDHMSCVHWSDTLGNDTMSFLTAYTCLSKWVGVQIISIIYHLHLSRSNIKMCPTVVRVSIYYQSLASFIYIFGPKKMTANFQTTFSKAFS